MPQKKPKAISASSSCKRNLIRFKKKQRTVQPQPQPKPPDPPRQPSLPKKAFIWTTCPRCFADVLSNDPKGFCCGNHTLIELPTNPNDLQQLLLTDKELQRNCRKYNNTFAFSAIGTTPTNGLSRIPDGPSNLILHGQIYHRMPNGTVYSTRCSRIDQIL